MDDGLMIKYASKYPKKKIYSQKNVNYNQKQKSIISLKKQQNFKYLMDNKR